MAVGGSMGVGVELVRRRWLSGRATSAHDCRRFGCDDGTGGCEGGVSSARRARACALSAAMPREVSSSISRCDAPRSAAAFILSRSARSAVRSRGDWSGDFLGSDDVLEEPLEDDGGGEGDGCDGGGFRFIGEDGEVGTEVDDKIWIVGGSGCGERFRLRASARAAPCARRLRRRSR